MFPDSRPDRQIIASNSAEGTFLGTSSISRQITENIIVSESVTGTQNPVSGGGGLPDGLVPYNPQTDLLQVPDSGSYSGSGGY
jgi:hypothetical protein